MMGMRSELKFYITPFHHALLSSRLGAVLKQDPYMQGDSFYKVRSLYFDDPESGAYREKINGLEKREKFRIRFYNDDLSFLRLEKKEKIGKFTRKILQPIVFDEAKMLMEGKVFSLDSADLLGEISRKIRFKGYRPCFIVDYKRSAFCYPAGNVRITLDSHLRGAAFRGELLDPGALLSVPTETDHILEIKFDSFFPPHLKELFSDIPKVSSAISKFCLTRDFLYKE